MKYFKIILIMVLTLNVYCQDHSSTDRTIEFISSLLKIQESNPSYLSESDELNKILDDAFSIYSKKGIKQDEKIDNIFRVLYKNGNSYYEDSQDERRYKIRRALCFVSIALISDSEKSNTFVKHAKLALIGDVQNPDIELLEDNYLGVLLTEILLKDGNDILSINDLKEVQKFLKKNQVSSESSLKKAKDIVERLEDKLSPARLDN